MIEQADSIGIRTIALPLIGAGLGGLPAGTVQQCRMRVVSPWSGQVTRVLQ